MKYEKPDLEVIFFDDFVTTLGYGDSEGGIENGFPGVPKENGIGDITLD